MPLAIASSGSVLIRKMLLIVLIAGISPAGYPLWGQAPGVGKEASSNQKNQPSLTAPRSQDDQRGTKGSPLIIETHPRPDGPEEAAKHKAENTTKEYRDGWTFRLTIANALFTGVLVVLTGGLLGVGWRGVNAANRTLSQIRRQTKATQQGIQHVVNSERAWVVLTPDPQFTLRDGVHKLDWKIWNRGKSIARIIEANIFTEKKTPGYEYRSFDEVKRLMEPIKFYNVPLPPDSSTDAWCQMFDVEGLDATALEEIKNHGRELLAYGYVRYIDAFENERESRFAFYFAPVFNGFRIDLRAPEEYHRCT
jgi:hypothetical protein